MTSLYTALVSRAIFPLQEHLKGHNTVQLLRQMEQSQWLTPDEIALIQQKRLRQLLDRASRHVPYYRKVFNNVGLDVANATASDLHRLPLLGKHLIRANLDELKSETASSLRSFSTGGSSGEPLLFLIGKERVAHDVAAKWRATRWWGVDIGDRELVIWGSPIELNRHDRMRMLRDRAMRTELLPAFNLTSETLATFVSRIRNRRPRMLFGYPSAISLIANHARRMNADLSKLGIRVVFVTSELLYDHQRDLISNVFGCPVANGYGGRDAGFVAHECPSGGMHITAEDILVEVIDDNGAPLPHGMPGEIVVTHLATSDFPFIRYRTGDRGVLSPDPCSCGRGLPLLAEIQGRSTDFVVAQDGTIMHGLALIYVLREIVGIRQFRIVQESCELVRAEIVTAKEGNQDQIERAVVSGFKARLGQGVNVQVDFLPMISSERSGKFRYVVSHVVTSREPSYHTHA